MAEPEALGSGAERRVGLGPVRTLGRGPVVDGEDGLEALDSDSASSRCIEPELCEDVGSRAGSEVLRTSP